MREEQSNMSKLFSPFGRWTEQYVKVKRGNESEWDDCIKAEIGIVNEMIALVNYNFATITHLPWSGNRENVFPFFKSENLIIGGEN